MGESFVCFLKEIRGERGYSLITHPWLSPLDFVVYGIDWTSDKRQIPSSTVKNPTNHRNDINSLKKKTPKAAFYLIYSNEPINI
jgi:hypothetical protein